MAVLDRHVSDSNANPRVWLACMFGALLALSGCGSDETLPDEGKEDAGGQAADSGQGDGGDVPDASTDAGDGSSLDSGMGFDAGPTNDPDAGGGDGSDDAAVTMDAGLDAGGDAGPSQGDAGESDADAGEPELVNGLRGDYYDGSSFITFKFNRIDDNVDFDWGTTGADERLPKTVFFSVRWLGFIEPAVTGTYKFYVSADDGQRLWVNEQKICDGWAQGGSNTEESEPIELEAGQRYPIRLDMFQHSNVATAKLEWETTDGTVVREVVPKERLFALPLEPKPAFLTFEAENTAPDGSPPSTTATGATASSGNGSAPQTSSCDNCSNYTRVPLDPAPKSGSLTFHYVNVPAAGDYLLQIWYTYKGPQQGVARYAAPAKALMTINGGAAQEVLFLNNYNDMSVFDSVDFTVPLKLGDNEITIAGLTVGAGTVNLDRITLRPAD